MVGSLLTLFGLGVDSEGFGGDIAGWGVDWPLEPEETGDMENAWVGSKTKEISMKN